jgi:uridine kinase
MQANKSPVEFEIVEPRQNVEIHLPDGQIISGPRNAPVGEFLKVLPASNQPPIVCAIVNNELRELTYPIQMDANVKAVTMGESDGMRVYRRSLVFLLETAFDHLFKGAILTVDHSVSFGGYYCQVSQRAPLSTSELVELERTMRQLVEADFPFQRQIVPIDEAIEYFKAEGEEDKADLLIHRQKPYLTIYKLENHRDYHHGYMVPSTGYLRWFQLTPAGEGFTLRFPRSQAPTEILPIAEYPMLLATFRQYGNWLNRLGISSVGALNNAIKNNRVNEVILVSEALHEQRVSEIAAQIANHRKDVRVVLISGPTSSGKTTFSKRLSIQMLASGLAPCPLEMDNYFKNRDETPPGEDGKPDFESINALDQTRLSDDLLHLISGETVQMPHYNFITGQRETGEEIQLTSDQIIILEGIHGLNPALLSSLPEAQTFRIYVSALTQLNLDRHNRVSTTDTRLIRRIVRDASQRGYSAQQTIQRWGAVRRGEKRYIFPYQENADAMFNSALVYELSALKPIAEPLLRQVPYGTTEYVEAKRLLAFLEWFLPIEADLIPDNSILREFIGNSILRNVTLWRNHNK